MTLLTSILVSSEAIAGEYGICLLPSLDHKTKIENLSSTLQKSFVKNDISYNAVKNDAHVSIFQGVFDEKKLAELKKRLSFLAQKFALILS